MNCEHQSVRERPKNVEQAKPGKKKKKTRKKKKVRRARTEYDRQTKTASIRKLSRRERMRIAFTKMKGMK